ncbi:MAG: hypothetical protein WD336_08695 [Trueperaceae bacterium]
MKVHLREDGLLQLPAEAIKASAIAFLRIFLGVMWLFEATLGPDAAADGVVVTGAKLLLGLAFVLGVVVRPLALVTLGAGVGAILDGDVRIAPLFAAMHLFVLVSAAGNYYGLDGFVLLRTRGSRKLLARAIHSLLDLPVFQRGAASAATALFGLLGLYFVLTVPTRGSQLASAAALEMALLCGAVAVGFVAADRYHDRLTALVAALRIYVGVRFLLEIWTHVGAGLDGLPGFASADVQRETFAIVAANHWPAIGRLVDTATVVTPVMWMWVVAFGAVQLLVGVALIVGCRSRVAGFVGLTYVGGLMMLGLTRLSPFLFGLLVVVVALDGGRVLSFDSVRGPAREVRFGLPVPVRAVPVLVGLAAINAVAATFTAVAAGITADGYTDSMPAVVSAFVAIFSGLLALVGWLQKHPSFDHSGEILPVRGWNEFV